MKKIGVIFLFVIILGFWGCDLSTVPDQAGSNSDGQSALDLEISSMQEAVNTGQYTSAITTDSQGHKYIAIDSYLRHGQYYFLPGMSINDFWNVQIFNVSGTAVDWPRSTVLNSGVEGFVSVEHDHVLFHFKDGSKYIKRARLRVIPVNEGIIVTPLQGQYTNAGFRTKAVHAHEYNSYATLGNDAYQVGRIMLGAKTVTKESDSLVAFKDSHHHETRNHFLNDIYLHHFTNPANIESFKILGHGIVNKNGLILNDGVQGHIVATVTSTNAIVRYYFQDDGKIKRATYHLTKSYRHINHIGGLQSQLTSIAYANANNNEEAKDYASLTFTNVKIERGNVFYAIGTVKFLAYQPVITQENSNSHVGNVYFLNEYMEPGKKYFIPDISISDLYNITSFSVGGGNLKYLSEGSIVRNDGTDGYVSVSSDSTKVYFHFVDVTSNIMKQSYTYRAGFNVQKVSGGVELSVESSAYSHAGSVPKARDYYRHTGTNLADTNYYKIGAIRLGNTELISQPNFSGNRYIWKDALKNDIRAYFIEGVYRKDLQNVESFRIYDTKGTYGPRVIPNDGSIGHVQLLSDTVIFRYKDGNLIKAVRYWVWDVEGGAVLAKWIYGGDLYASTGSNALAKDVSKYTWHGYHGAIQLIGDIKITAGHSNIPKSAKVFQAPYKTEAVDDLAELRLDELYQFQVHNTYKYGTLKQWLDLGYRSIEIDVLNVNGDYADADYPSDEENYPLGTLGPVVSHEWSSKSHNACKHSRGSTVESRLADCLDNIKTWINNNPDNEIPITIFIDMKSTLSDIVLHNLWNVQKIRALDQWVANYLDGYIYDNDDLLSHLGTNYNSYNARTLLKSQGWPKAKDIGNKVVVALTGGKVLQENSKMDSAMDNYSPSMFFCPKGSASAPHTPSPGESISGFSSNNAENIVCLNIKAQDHVQEILNKSTETKQLNHIYFESGDFETTHYGYRFMAVAHGAMAISIDLKSPQLPTAATSIPVVGKRRGLPGYFMIQTEDSDQCLEAMDYSNYGTLRFQDCDYTKKGQRFVYTAEGQLRPFGEQSQNFNHYCVDVEGASTGSNVTAHLWDCDGGTSEKWHMSSDGYIASMMHNHYWLTGIDRHSSYASPDSIGGATAPAVRVARATASFAYARLFQHQNYGSGVYRKFRLIEVPGWIPDHH